MASRKPNPPEDDTNSELDEQTRKASPPPQDPAGEDPGTDANSPVIVNR